MFIILDVRSLEKFIFEGIAVKILFVGDVVGPPGIGILKDLLPTLKKQFDLDLVVANGENAAEGNGLTRNLADIIFDAGVDIITGGNHIWDCKDIYKWINSEQRVVRPCNYPEGTPGKGFTKISIDKTEVLVINLCGRVFMPSLDCPFQKFEQVLSEVADTAVIFVDFHAEATSEKMAFGYFADGRAAAVIGTHTHVQTADERILPKGTAYITDIGMTGPAQSVLGIKKEIIISAFRTHRPQKFEIARGKAQFNACLVEIESNTRRAARISRIQRMEEN